MIRRGLRDLAVVALGMCAVTGLLSLLIGAAAGMSALRSLSAGYLLVGAFLFTAGAVVGLRDPGRSRYRVTLTRRGGSSAGPATWSEAFHLSALLVGLGMGLVLLGVVLHPTTAP